MSQTIIVVTSCALVTAVTALYQRRLLLKARQLHQYDLANIKAHCNAMRKALAAASDAATQRNADLVNLQLQNDWLQIRVGALQAQLDSERASARN